MNPQGYQTSRRDHERKDADVISLAMIAGVLLLVLVISLLVSWGMLRDLNRDRAERERPVIRMAEASARFPQPQLITEPGQEWRETRLAAEARLQSYGWVDRKAGVAHIPIGEAMQLLLQRGLPEVGAGQTRLQLMQSRPQSDVQPDNPVTAPAPEKTP